MSRGAKLATAALALLPLVWLWPCVFGDRDFVPYDVDQFPVLTLADRDTPVWLAAEFDRPEIRDFLRFHAGAPIVAQRADAVFAVLTSATPHPFDGFNLGTDAYPDRSATLIVEVADLRIGPPRQWHGPGIDRREAVTIAGLSDDFWQDWAANHGLFPCGVDIVFTAGSELCALPRSVAVEV